jgi:hypothetical protein
VASSARNQGLAEAIAQAYITGMIQLCDDNKLQYTWMRYLPVESSYPWDGLWRTVVNGIKNRLARTPIMRPASGGPLELISSQQRHSPAELDQNGRPLFSDIRPYIYLSLSYRSADLDLLTPHGLRRISNASILSRVRADLQSVLNSKMKSTARDQDWHSRAAKLLSAIFDAKNHQDIRTLRALAIVPTTERGWVAIKDGSVFYAQSGFHKIPSGSGLDVLPDWAASNTDRKKFFDRLGVETASHDVIRKSIFDVHTSQLRLPSLPQSVEHMRFLYLTHHSAKPPYDYDKLRVFGEDNQVIRRDTVDFYLPNDDPYGASLLLRPTSQAPGQPAFFINDTYLKDPPTLLGQAPWVEWIYSHLNARRRPRIVNKQRPHDTLSDECKYIARCRPEKFVEFLHAAFPDERTLVKKDAIASELSQTNVLCVNGEHECLSATYLPTRERMERCNRYLPKGGFFPFCQLERSLASAESLEGWVGLTKAVGFGDIKGDTDFDLRLLERIEAQAAHEIYNAGESEKVYRLYKALQAHVKNDDGDDAMESIREYHDESFPIYVPNDPATGKANWVSLDKCVWSSPAALKTKCCLEIQYQATFSSFSQDRAYMADFFKNTLQLADCRWEDIVEEIESLADSDDVDFDRVTELYSCLANLEMSEDEKEDMSEEFGENPLIFNPEDGSWHNTYDCLWSTTTRIPGMIALVEHYEELEDFFVGTLGVEQMTLQMVYDKLKDNTPALSVTEAKSTLLAFSALLISADEKPARNPVLESQVFPVRGPDGTLELRKGTEIFAIIDRADLAKDFEGKASLLDFTLEEFRSLQALISWAGLENRVLSVAVKEITSVDSDSVRPVRSSQRQINRRAHALLR